MLASQPHIRTGTEEIQQCDEVAIVKYEVILDKCVTLYKRIMNDDIFDNEVD
jgi:hypothetical protein